MKTKYRSSDGVCYKILNSMTYILRPAIWCISLLGKKYKGFAKKAEPEGKDVKLSFGVLADVHLLPTHWRTGKFCTALCDMEKASATLDALAIAGDITDHGGIAHWERVKAVFGEFPTVKPVLAIGNHDSWGESENGEEDGIKDYVKYRNEICAEVSEKPYYSVNVRGYEIICLATEGESEYARISDEQIAWLKSRLEEGTKDGKPVFVISHEAINGTHGLPRTFGDRYYDEMTGGLGEKSEEIKELLGSYKNVFLFSGHSHMGLHNPQNTIGKDYGTFEETGSVVSVNLPCFMFANHCGLKNSGIGIIVDVYEDRVRLRARSHIWRVWYKGYEYTKWL